MTFVILNCKNIKYIFDSMILFNSRILITTLLLKLFDISRQTTKIEKLNDVDWFTHVILSFACILSNVTLMITCFFDFIEYILTSFNFAFDLSIMSIHWFFEILTNCILIILNIRKRIDYNNLLKSLSRNIVLNKWFDLIMKKNLQYFQVQRKFL